MKEEMLRVLTVPPKELNVFAPLPSRPVLDTLSIPRRGDEPHKAVCGEFLGKCYNQALQALGILFSVLGLNAESEIEKAPLSHPGTHH